MAERITDFVTSHVMKRLFEGGLWSEKKIKIFGRAAKTKVMKIVELE